MILTWRMREANPRPRMAAAKARILAEGNEKIWRFFSEKELMGHQQHNN